MTLVVTTHPPEVSFCWTFWPDYRKSYQSDLYPGTRHPGEAGWRLQSRLKRETACCDDKQDDH